MRWTRRAFLRTTSAALLSGLLAACSGERTTPTTAPDASSGNAPTVARSRPALDVLRLDYAYYNPVSLVLKQQGWVEQEFAADGTKVEWVLSLGSNKANEFTASGAVHFGSTAGSAALLARANGVPLKTVWIYAQPEWTALVARADSPIESPADLRGKKVAATRGTDPWFFLLRALDSVGLSSHDVTIVQLQHPDGEQALLRGDVDAWAGLDPHMAHAELTAGARLFFRRREWNTYGTLNALESFIAEHPDVVERVLALYERGRQWALAHPDELAQILSEAAKLDLAIARKVLSERVSFPDPVPGEVVRETLRAVLPLIRKENLVPSSADLDGALATLLESGPAQRARANGGG
ncbi:MAG: aliphatic sulfonate ABC transporter substrate-binding protein [Thermomicrobium sp.]|nr:aliphatic sulfonate ABC transporter substrate-binding protein [Thermomicrobium sp.]